MQKLNIFMLTLIIVATLVRPVISVPIYLDKINTGVECTVTNSQSSITVKDAYTLLQEVPSQEENLTYSIPLRSVTDYMNYFVRWNRDGIYLSTVTPLIARYVIGYSNQQRTIEAVYIVPPDYTQTILTTFALHGFEDAYAGDGQLLVDIAELVIKHYSDQPELLQFTRLIVVPCVNPDGVYASARKLGLGRYNTQGIDLNRDFDYNWSYIAGNKASPSSTGDKPFSGTESIVLRELVLKEDPDIVLDFHGWYNCCFTDDLDMRNIFNQNLNLGSPTIRPKGLNPRQGYFFGWASQYARAALIEYPLKDTDVLVDKTILALDQIIQKQQIFDT